MNAPDRLLILPPHSIEAEHAVLGGLLLDSSAWDRVCDILTDADFYRDDHRRIYRHIRILADAGKPVDVLGVYDSIERSNEIDQTGGLAYLGEIANATPSAANIRRHAEIIRDRAALRRLMVIGDTLAGQCLTSGKAATELIEDVERQLAMEGDDNAAEPSNLSAVMVDALAYIDSRGETSGVRTGFADLDRLTGGFEPGQLVIVAARPSVGKTLFACNVADQVATTGGAVLFFTLEMSRREIGMRILAARSAVPVHAMRSGTKSDADWQKMTRVLPGVEKQRLWIDDKPAVPVSYIRARARRVQRKHGLDLVVVDYLGLMKGQGDNRVQEIGSISRGLKALAKELQVPIIALAQLNRGVEGRPDKRPMMSDLRDSGEIEQDADIIVMMHREALYNDAPEWENFAELIVRKNRNGPLGDVHLHYDGKLMLLTPWAWGNPRTVEKKPQGRGFRD